MFTDAILLVIKYKLEKVPILKLSNFKKTNS